MKKIVILQATYMTSVNVELVSGGVKITHLVGGLFAEEGYMFLTSQKRGISCHVFLKYQATIL